MSRAQQTQQLQTGNTMVANENATAGTAGSGALSGYQSMYANPGYTPAQQSAITNATEAGVGAAAGTAANQEANAAARSGNSAGLTSGLDSLARQRMITSGNLGAQNQVTFANDAQKQQQQALQGMQGIYGTALGGANNTLGTNARNAATPSFGDQVGSGLAKLPGEFLSPSAAFGFG
jgi:hypothetical protein